MSKISMAVGFTFLATLVGLIGLITFNAASVTRPLVVDPVKLRQDWAGATGFVGVAERPDFRAAIAARVGSMAAGLGLPEDRTAELADTIDRFLLAYGRGEFQTFWRFRSPTGAYTSRELAGQGLAKAVKQVNQFNAAAGRGGEVQVPDPSKVEELWPLLWNGVEKISLLDRTAFPAKLRSIRLPCTHCVSGASLPTFDLVALRSDGRPPDLVALIKARGAAGVWVNEGAITLRPDVDSVRKANKGTVEFMLFSAVIRTAAGVNTPVYLLSYWAPGSRQYLPYAVGSADSSEYGVRLLF
jgi:hypothetical protein